jgi:hypothetical protein
MRVFLISCVAIIVLAVGGYVGLNAVQKLSGLAYTTEGARIKQNWTYRRIAARAAPTGHAAIAPGTATDASEDCDVSTTWRWILIDFSDSRNEAPSCS